MLTLAQAMSSMYQYGEANDAWMESLRQRCEEAEEGKWYFDSKFRRCCLCSECMFPGHALALVCPEEKQCRGQSRDCVNEPEFDMFFPAETTPPTTAEPTTSVANTTALPLTRSPTMPATPPMGSPATSQKPHPASPRNFLQSSLTIMVAILIIVIIVVFVSCCLVKRKKGCFEATWTKVKRLIHKTSEDDHGTASRGNFESEALVEIGCETFVESGEAQNFSPKREDGISIISSCDEDLKPSRRYDDKSPPPGGLRNQNYVRPDQNSFSENSGADVPPQSGMSAYVLNTGCGKVVINSMTIINGQDSQQPPSMQTSRAPPCEAPSTITAPLTASRQAGTFSDITDGAYSTQTPMRATRPERRTEGSCVTSKTYIKAHTSDTPPRQNDGISGRASQSAFEQPGVRRQSSNMSSTSTGAVENESTESDLSGYRRYCHEARVHDHHTHGRVAVPTQEMSQPSIQPRNLLPRQRSESRHDAIVESHFPGTARPVRPSETLLTPYEESQSTACEHSENTFDILRPPP